MTSALLWIPDQVRDDEREQANVRSPPQSRPRPGIFSTEQGLFDLAPPLLAEEHRLAAAESRAAEHAARDRATGLGGEPGHDRGFLRACAGGGADEDAYTDESSGNTGSG